MGSLYITHRGSGTNVSATATAYVASQQRVGTTVALAPSPTPQPPAAQQPKLVQCLDGSTREVCPTVAPTNTPIPVPTNTPVPQQVVAAANVPVSQPVVQAPVSQPATQGSTGLPVSEVKGWCSGSGCSTGLFEQVNEGGGINPNAVHFKVNSLDDASSFTVPAGVSVSGWDCYNPINARGPATIKRVCEATFRR